MFKKKGFLKRLGIIWGIGTPAVSFFLLESLTHSVAEDMEWPLILLNLIFYYLFYGLIFVISKRSWISISFGSLCIMIAGLINYYVIQFRSVPIYPWDIFSIKTAASVSENYDYHLDQDTRMILAGFFVLIIVGLFTRWKLEIKNRQHHLLSVLLTVLGMTLYGTSVQTSAVHEAVGFYEYLFTPNAYYQLNGLAASFISNMQYLKISKPGNYSPEKAEELLKRYASEERELPEQKPNVIVVMNEAFSDPAVLGEFETNVDYMPFIRSLTENTVKGNAYVSVKGGNTANSEFEFLTGDSMAYLPVGSIPYQQYIRGEMPTLVSQFNNMGYTTSFIHPYRANGWNRKNIYNYFGMDACYFKESFKDAPILREYTTDLATYQKIVDIYNEKAEGEPMFVFDVTMQNHSSYSKEYENFVPDVEVYGEQRDMLLERYLSLIKVSDGAFEKLVEYFSNVDEPTVILMFGDHQPADWVVKPIYTMNGETNMDDPLVESEEKRYEVPFVLWANYDIEEEYVEATSLNYLGALLMDKAGLPLSSWQNYLKALSQSYPVITANAYMTAEGDWWSNLVQVMAPEVSGERLSDYRILNYYHLFDGRHRDDSLFE